MVEAAEKRARWKLDAAQLANYGIAPNRILDTVPAGCISVRLGEKIFVRKLRSTGSSALIFDENTINGLALQMSQNNNNEQFVSKVLMSPGVVDDFVKNAFESPEDLMSHIEVGLSDSNDD